MPKKICSVEGITEFELPNGLRILLYPDVSRPSVTVNLTVFVGSRHEGYGEAGMAHLLEHMVFKGTPDHPNIMDVLKERGAQANGTTWLDRTNYYETLSSSDENLGFAIRFEADRMVNSFIRPEDLASEMTVVRNEFEGTENNIRRVLTQKMMAAGFEWHNYGKTTIGNKADIERVPASKLKDFYKRFYQPDNAMLVVAGKFDEAKALEYITKYFGAIPRPQRTLDQTYTEEPAQDGDRLVTLRRVGEVPMAGLMYHIPAGGHPDFPAVDVLATILSSQPSGRLYALVKKHQAASVSGFAFALHDPGMMLLMSNAAQDIKGTTLLQGMIDAAENGEPFTEEEVERARQQLLRQRDQTVRNTTGFAVGLSEWAAQGDWRLFFLYRDRLETLTADDINRVARQFLTRNNRTAGLFEPTSGAERVAIPPTPNLAEMIGDYKGREQIAPGEEFDPSPLAIEARVARSAVNDGQFKITLLPKKTLGEAVNLRMSLRYGNLEYLKGKATAADILGAMMMRGTQKLSRQDIKDQFDKYRAQAGVSGQAGRLTVSIQTQRHNIVSVLKIVQQILREPAFPEEELELLRQAIVASAEQRLTDPRSIASNAIMEALNPYAADDPRYITTLMEDIDRIKSLKLEDVKSLYHSAVQGGVDELTIVGDCDMQTTQAAAVSMLGGWTSDVDYERIPQLCNNNTEGSFQSFNTPDKGQANFSSALTVPLKDDHEDYPALTMGNYILGGGLSSRLGKRVRQQEGLSYGIGSTLQGSALDERCVFSIRAICAPDKTDRVKQLIEEELQTLLNNGVTEDELTSQSGGLLERRNLSRTSDGSLAASLATQSLVGRTMEFVAEFEAKIAALTVDEVNSALRKHIDPKRLYIAVAGDFGKQSAAPTVQ